MGALQEQIALLARNLIKGVPVGRGTIAKIVHLLAPFRDAKFKLKMGKIIKKSFKN